MNRKQLAVKVRDRVAGGKLPELTIKQAEMLIKAVFDSITDELMTGTGKASVRGFGRFDIQVRRARMGRNPRTGAPAQVPQRKTVRFAVSLDLRGKLNQ